MPTFDLAIQLGNGEIELTVEYAVTGSYLPATLIDPPEEPELELQSVTYKGAPIPWWMEQVLMAELHEFCWSDHEGRSRSAEDDRFDYYWQQLKDRAAERRAA